MFKEGGGPEMMREKREEERKDTHLEALRARFDSKMRRGTSFVDAEGNREPVLGANAKDEIQDFAGNNPEQPIRVGTQSGAIAEKDREMFTEGIAGCIGVFVKGAEKNAMIHCTPNYGFAHTRPEETSKLIEEQLKEHGMKMEDVTMTIIGTMGRESGKFGYEEENENWNNLAESLKEKGASAVGIAEVPMTDMTLYYSPDQPDKLLAMGDSAFYDEDGRFRTKVKNRKEVLVDLNKFEKQEFGITRPGAKEELVDEDDDEPIRFSFDLG